MISNKYRIKVAIVKNNENGAKFITDWMEAYDLNNHNNRDHSHDFHITRRVIKKLVTKKKLYFSGNARKCYLRLRASIL